MTKQSNTSAGKAARAARRAPASSRSARRARRPHGRPFTGEITPRGARVAPIEINAQVKVVAEGPWQGECGTVVGLAEGDELVVQLDRQAKPLIIFGAQELELLAPR